MTYLSTGLDNCLDTMLYLSVVNDIPQELKNYTDGYIAELETTLYEGLYSGEMRGICFGDVDDT
jgi:hypothetical protein